MEWHRIRQGAVTIKNKGLVFFGGKCRIHSIFVKKVVNHECFSPRKNDENEREVEAPAKTVIREGKIPIEYGLVGSLVLGW